MAKQTIGERMTEVETTLFGATRNEGGFIAETRDTLQIVRAGMDSLGSELRGLQSSVKELARRGKGLVKILEVTIPPFIVGLGSVIAVILTRA